MKQWNRNWFQHWIAQQRLTCRKTNQRIVFIFFFERKLHFSIHILLRIGIHFITITEKKYILFHEPAVCKKGLKTAKIYLVIFHTIVMVMFYLLIHVRETKDQKQKRVQEWVSGLSLYGAPNRHAHSLSDTIIYRHPTICIICQLIRVSEYFKNKDIFEIQNLFNFRQWIMKI